jgi:hypothetical protein|tara:strand:+ start:285 stop:479 length:195 start_codon:yes stop_codon:yes gene_type:complete
VDFIKALYRNPEPLRVHLEYEVVRKDKYQKPPQHYRHVDDHTPPQKGAKILDRYRHDLTLPFLP